MPQKALADSLALAELLEAYPDNDAAEQLFIWRRWPDGVTCPFCVSKNIQEDAPHPEMPFRCRSCNYFFSVRTGTVMYRSKIGYRGWLIAMHRVLMTPGGKGARQLGEDLGITEQSARSLTRRIREACTA